MDSPDDSQGASDSNVGNVGMSHGYRGADSLIGSLGATDPSQGCGSWQPPVVSPLTDTARTTGTAPGPSSSNTIGITTTPSTLRRCPQIGLLGRLTEDASFSTPPMQQPTGSYLRQSLPMGLPGVQLIHCPSPPPHNVSGSRLSILELTQTPVVSVASLNQPNVYSPMCASGISSVVVTRPPSQIGVGSTPCPPPSPHGFTGFRVPQIPSLNTMQGQLRQYPFQTGPTPTFSLGCSTAAAPHAFPEIGVASSGCPPIPQYTFPGFGVPTLSDYSVSIGQYVQPVTQSFPTVISNQGVPSIGVPAVTHSMYLGCPPLSAYAMPGLQVPTLEHTQDTTVPHRAYHDEEHVVANPSYAGFPDSIRGRPVTNPFAGNRPMAHTVYASCTTTRSETSVETHSNIPEDDLYGLPEIFERCHFPASPSNVWSTGYREGGEYRLSSDTGEDDGSRNATSDSDASSLSMGRTRGRPRKVVTAAAGSRRPRGRPRQRAVFGPKNKRGRPWPSRRSPDISSPESIAPVRTYVPGNKSQWVPSSPQSSVSNTGRKQRACVSERISLATNDSSRVLRPRRGCVSAHTSVNFGKVRQVEIPPLLPSIAATSSTGISSGPASALEGLTEVSSCSSSVSPKKAKRGRRKGAKAIHGFRAPPIPPTVDAPSTYASASEHQSEVSACSSSVTPQNAKRGRRKGATASHGFRVPVVPPTVDTGSTRRKGRSGQRRKAIRPRFPVDEPTANAEEVPINHPPGSLGLFLNAVPKSYRYTITANKFYTIPGSNIDAVEENNVGTMSRVCEFCAATYFKKEEPKSGLYLKCCRNGVVIVPRGPEYPPELKKLWLDQGPKGKSFRQNCRLHNNAAAFGCFTHNSIKLTGYGPKTYSVHGMTTHSTGSATPAPGKGARFSQLYILDSGMALQTRKDMPYYKALDPDIMKLIDETIRKINPIYKAFHNMKECQEALEARLAETAATSGTAPASSATHVKMYVGNNKEMNLRQFAPPTTADEISVVVPYDSDDRKPERHVTIFWKDGRLQRIHFANPILDALIYPLFFIHAQYGYSIHLFSEKRNTNAPAQFHQRVDNNSPSTSSSARGRPGTSRGRSTSSRRLSASRRGGSSSRGQVSSPVRGRPSFGRGRRGGRRCSSPATRNAQYDEAIRSVIEASISPLASDGFHQTQDLASSVLDQQLGQQGSMVNVEAQPQRSQASSPNVVPPPGMEVRNNAESDADEYPFEPMNGGDIEYDDDGAIIVPENLPTIKKKVSQMQFYAHMLHVKVGNEDDDNFNPIHHGGLLTHQYFCDGFVRVEEERLGFIRREQDKLRRADYTELHKSVQNFANKNNVPAGTVVILPSSFTNGERNMVNHYRDAMAIVGKLGKPDYFITFTCNPKWPEITDSLFEGQTANDRPDIVARVFELKVKEFINELYEEQPLGEVIAHTYAIEHQKRGLPHMHLLVVVKGDAKPNSAVKVDTVVSAEIPCKEAHPELHKKVLAHMIHGPCGAENMRCPCMAADKCTKSFPKEFRDETVIDSTTYPKYRRSDNHSHPVVVGNKHVHNGWVVPYNPYLLMKFNAHINVEICSSLQSVKYLYKYVHKGHDKVKVFYEENGRMIDAEDLNPRPDAAQANTAVPGPSAPPPLNPGEVNLPPTGTTRQPVAAVDEIDKHIKGRYVSAPEACARLLEFKSTKTSHTVHRLPVHLPGDQSILFAEGHEDEALALHQGRHTQLTAWFELNKRDVNARQYRYTQIPEHYTWHKSSKTNPEKNFTWQGRKLNWDIIPRLHNVPPRNMELFALRTLLLYVTGCESWDDIKKDLDGNVCATFLEAAMKRGLLEDDRCWDETLEEAVAFQMPFALRNLFGMILCHGTVTDPLKLWDKYKIEMMDDYLRSYPENAESLALRDINEVILMNGKEVEDFPLPTPAPLVGRRPPQDGFSPDHERDLAEERISNLNPGQKAAVQRVLYALRALDAEFKIHKDLRYPPGDGIGQHDGPAPADKLFYLDGPGGTGKTFVYNTIMSIVRSQRCSVIAVAPTGIAATLLPGGRTAHSRFGIPMDIKDISTSTIKHNTRRARELQEAPLIIWDEISMTHKYHMKVVDRILKDLMHNDLPFGGKVVVVGGDFRQQLPVVKGGGENEIVLNSVVFNENWASFKKMQLTQNMRTDSNDREFADWLLDLGDGRIPRAHPDFPEIAIPEDFILKKTEDVSSMADYIYGRVIYPEDAEDHVKKAILCPLNEDTFRVNADILQRLEGTMVTYRSIDEAKPLSGDPFDSNEFPMELLNKSTPSGMPPHELNVKVGAIIMLLRNLNPKLGMVNGARLKVITCEPNAKIIKAQFLAGQHKDKYVLIPRIKLCQTELDTDLPVRLSRYQFPIRLAYSMTINKSQGQTLESVGVILSMPVFSHGMLYTAFSRVSKRCNIKVQIGPELLENPSNKTANVVYHDIFWRRDNVV